MSIKKVILPDREVKWDVRFYENGRGSKRIFKRFDRKQDAIDFKDKIKEEVKQKELNPFGTVSFKDRTFKEEAEYWLEDGKLNFSAGHIKRVEGVFKELIPRFGDLTLEKFTPELLNQYQKDEKKKGNANATVNRKTNIIMAVLNYSVRQRRIPFNPSAGFRKMKDDRNPIEFWNQQEARSFLTKMNELYPKGSSQRWVHLVYLVALNTGMRAGEIWGLRPTDLCDDGETIRVRYQFNRVTQDFGLTKGKNTRLVPCPKLIFQELQDLIASEGLKSEQTIFRNEKGKPICHDNFIDRQYQKDLKRWGGRAIRFHDLRHTAATLLVASEQNLKTVQYILGHADMETTMNYVHLVDGSVNKVAKTFSVMPESTASVTQLKVV